MPPQLNQDDQLSSTETILEASGSSSPPQFPTPNSIIPSLSFAASRYPFTSCSVQASPLERFRCDVDKATECVNAYRHSDSGKPDIVKWMEERDLERGGGGFEDEGNDDGMWTNGTDDGDDEILCRPPPRSIKAQARIPQTMGFYFDWWIGRMGAQGESTDFKQLCASMMLWREANSVDHYPTCRVPNILPVAAEAVELQDTDDRQSGPDAIRDSGDQFVTLTDWDFLLQEMAVARDRMHKWRKWKMRGMKRAAGWCRLEVRDRARAAKAHPGRCSKTMMRAVEDRGYAGHDRDRA